MSNEFTIRDFVDKNVLYNQSGLVEDCLSNERLQWDDVENLYEGEEDDQKEQEIFSWYLVSEYLADELADKGEPVLRAANCQWWGRTVFGQLIESDSVIEDIFNSLNK